MSQQQAYGTAVYGLLPFNILLCGIHSVSISWISTKHTPVALEIQNKNMGIFFVFKNHFTGLPGGTLVKNPPANAGDTGSSPDPGRSHMPRSN